MRCLLDTNIVIFVLKDPAGKAAARLKQEAAQAVAICAVVEAELYHGATKCDAPERRRFALDGFLAPFRSLAFDSACVPHYARIRDKLERAGQIMGGHDLMIAAIALAHDLTVVTHNCAEFERVPGLRVEDWAAGAPGERSESPREKFMALFGEILRSHAHKHGGPVELENAETFVLRDQDMDLLLVQALSRRARELKVRLKLM